MLDVLKVMNRAVSRMLLVKKSLSSLGVISHPCPNSVLSPCVLTKFLFDLFQPERIKVKADRKFKDHKYRAALELYKEVNRAPSL